MRVNLKNKKVKIGIKVYLTNLNNKKKIRLVNFRSQGSIFGY